MYDFNAPATVLTLPAELDEISGLAITPDNRLFTHNDENGSIAEIDMATGAIRKQFQLGGKGADKDFEGIAIVGKRFFITTSAGAVFEFAEGKPDETVPVTEYPTELSTKNDVEGLCYDPATNSLLLACKERAGKGLDQMKAVYAFSLDSMKLILQPRFLLPIAQLLDARAAANSIPLALSSIPARARSALLLPKGNRWWRFRRKGRFWAR
ncbi:MAG: hypothetical protein UZ07_CHB004000908 [Chlorobi bacterium OLB7]|nr:MAG: hypothetical protein UZ07_CHB004000908 [Chlorobi bacterium OLB7]